VSHSSKSPMYCARVRGLAEADHSQESLGNLPPKPKHPDFFRSTASARSIPTQQASLLACLLPTQLHNTKHVRKQCLSGKVEGDGPRPNASAGAGTPTTSCQLAPFVSLRNRVAGPGRKWTSQSSETLSIAESAESALQNLCCLRDALNNAAHT
jgi:hypothetical protein